jgi:uncharacterized protein YndB with AHSA1/START domain
MPSILHRLTIDAPIERVQELAATKEGIEKWWTGRPVSGDDAVGGRLSVYFRDGGKPAASFDVVESGPQLVAWRCVEGPGDWIGTRIAFALEPTDDGATTLLFSHQGWREEGEFMSGCSTNWGAYLMSLKSGAEGAGFGAYPDGEVSRWS